LNQVPDIARRDHNQYFPAINKIENENAIPKATYNLINWEKKDWPEIITRSIMCFFRKKKNEKEGR
jgi:hypothetical protein